MSATSDADREAWLRFDDADDVTAEEWVVLARVRAAYLAATERRAKDGPLTGE
ncbi:hypothetical protein [Xylanimonas sp. McL0601]|uniref:hypothetical protein n=1 Tax=Xylanimonas sp. McL0601 TaxID=3414739 RepID=UPI003CEF7753